MPAEGARQRENNRERIDEALEVHHHQQIDEHGREDQSELEVGEGGIHAFDLAAHGEVIAGPQLMLQTGEDRRHPFGDRAEVGILHRGVDVIDALDVGVVEDRLHLLALHRRDIAQHIGDGRVHRRLADKRHIVEVVDGRNRYIPASAPRNSRECRSSDPSRSSARPARTSSRLC